MLSFRYGWLGAFVAFLGFNATIGLDIVQKAYLAFTTNGALDGGRNTKAEAAGNVLNYLLQLVIVAIWWSFLAGIDEYRVQEAKAHISPDSTKEIYNWGVIFFAISIFEWHKLFSDTPFLRQLCIDLMYRAFPRQQGEGKTSPRKRT